MTTTKPHSGLVELHLAVLLFGGMALFSKLIPLSALNITFLRCFIAAIMLATIIKATKGPLRLQRQRDYWAALAFGTFRDMSVLALGDLFCRDAVFIRRHWHDCLVYLPRHDGINRTINQ